MRRVKRKFSNQPIDDINIKENNMKKNEDKKLPKSIDNDDENSYSSEDENSPIIDEELSPEMTLLIFNKFEFKNAMRSSARKHFLNNLKYLSWEDLEMITNESKKIEKKDK